MNQASSDGTNRYFSRFPAIKNNPLGNTGLRVSSIGFGGYRVSDLEPLHREALSKALLSGINLIDTSSNYADGGSEKLIGDILQELIGAGKLARDEVVIVTKAGYVQGANLQEARRRLDQRSPFPEMVEYRPDCWHCISPEFLQDQIGRSLERLRIEKIDVMLLHNPEYFLRSGGSREEYAKRLKRAFLHLEKEVEAGRIARYGVSSNGFPETENKNDFTSLDILLELAQSAATELQKKQSHLHVIEFPLNLFEAGAALTSNNHGKTLLEVAKTRKLGALVNRPLNAYHRGRVFRLSSYRKFDEVEIKGELHRLLGKAIELEKKRLGDRSYQGLSWAHALRDKLGEFDDILQWREILSGQILPSLWKSMERVEEREPAWAEEYRPIITELLSLIGKDLETVSGKRSEVLMGQLAQQTPTIADSKNLSEFALRSLTGLSGVSSVLLGMRQLEYVDEAVNLRGSAAESEVHSLLQSLQKRS